MNALRSSASAMALRTSGLSNGAAVLLTIMLMVLLDGENWHVAFGACEATSFRPAIVTSERNVRSNSPAMKASSRVERLSMTLKSMPSR